MMKGGERGMATEAFLINPAMNPPKRLRRGGKVRVGKRRRKNPVGEMLTVIGANPSRRNPMEVTSNPWYGDSRGHRIAALMRWGKIPRGRIKRRRKRGGVVVRRVKRTRTRVVRRKRGRWAPKHIRMRRKIAQQAFWTTKYGHMLAHPRSRKVYTRKGFVTMATRKRKRKRNTWFGQPRRHRKAAKKGWRRGHLLSGSGGRRRRVRHNFFVNPMPGRKRRRSRSRGYRRNPAIMAEFGRFTSNLSNVREWAPLAVTGGLSAITGAITPGMLGVFNPWMKMGVQTAVAIGGGLVVERVVDKRHGQAWMIVGVAMVGYQLLKEFVLVPYFPQFAVGLGEYPSYYPDSAYVNRDQVSQQVGAFPNQVGAFVNDYPGVGNEMGAYPYDGSGY